MVCAEINSIQNGSLAGQSYFNDILIPIVLVYATPVTEIFAFIKDNSGPHQVNILRNGFDEITIIKLALKFY